MTNGDHDALGKDELSELFERYRASCPEVEPGSDFMPRLWQKIESRRSFGFVFSHLARTAMAASAALCLVLLVLNFVGKTEPRFASPTYVDALMAAHTAEGTYYTEAIRTTPSPEQAPGVQH